MPETTNQNRNSFTGSNLIVLNKDLLTDTNLTFDEIVFCAHSNNLLVDVIADKGLTVVITPVLDIDYDTTLGKPSDTGTLADGGGPDDAERFIYSTTGAPKARVLVTKTEAGDATKTVITVRGVA